MKSFWMAGAALAGIAGLYAGAAAAQIAVSGNDGKQPRLYERAADIKPDSVAVLDIRSYPPKVLGTVQVPYSMIGPPTSVAIAPDASFAISSQSQKVDPTDITKVVPDNTVSVIDLADPRRPVVTQTLTAGMGASGIAINRAGTLALVAATGDGTVSIYTIAGKRLTPAGALQLPKEPGPVDVAISPDGRTALVTQRRGSAIWRLAIDGTKVTDTGITYATGEQPYGVVFSRDGKWAYNTNLLGRPQPPRPPGQGGGQGGPPRIGTITAIDLTRNVVATTVEVGPTPEHVALSPDGRYLEVTVVNGSSANPTTANYNPYGLLKVYRVDGARMTLAAETRSAAWGQGAAWTDDGRAILLQSGIDKTIEVYRFNGTP